MFKLIVSIFLLLLTSFASITPTFAQQLEQFEAEVIAVSDDSNSEIPLQKIQIKPTEGRFEGQTLEVLHPPAPGRQNYQTGVVVVIDVSGDATGQDVFYISDYVRKTPLYLLFGLFIGMVILFGRKKGLFSLLSMGFSFLVIFFYLLPTISSGFNPITATLIASLVILPVTFYVSHGFNKTTTAAALSTLLTLGIISILMLIFIEAAKLTGFASEEASFIRMMKGDQINIKGLLYAGILIATIGILDDITTAQASLVSQLKKTSAHLTDRKLYFHAMEVGKDHIASLVNTLVLVYTGASLPLLLLFTDMNTAFSRVLNYEIVAEEVLRILIASIGLIAAVPITTLITIKLLGKKLVQDESQTT